jgi:hypothetical protein
MKGTPTCPEMLSECIDLAEAALEDHKGMSPARQQLIVPEAQNTMPSCSAGVVGHSLSSGVAETSLSSRVVEQCSSSCVAGPSLATLEGTTLQHPQFCLLCCTASFARDQQVQIALPLNILFTATRPEVQFYHVTFGEDFELIQWMNYHLEWVRALSTPSFTQHCCGVVIFYEVLHKHCQLFQYSP